MSPNSINIVKNESLNRNDSLALLRLKSKDLQEPQNLFQGNSLPEGFELPNNILVFHHNWAERLPNSHGRYTLVFALDKMTYIVDQTKIEMVPGNILLIHPNKERFLVPSRSSGFSRLFITFELKKPQLYLPSYALNDMPEEGWKIVNDIIATFSKGETVDVATLIVNLFNNFNHELSNVKSKPLSKTVSKAIALINDESAKTYGSKEIANEIGVSESNLRRLFKKETGKSTRDYITTQRLNAAQSLLVNTKLKVSDIAIAVGYSDVYVFSHAFKQHMKEPPLQFRRNNT